MFAARKTVSQQALNSLYYMCPSCVGREVLGVGAARQRTICALPRCADYSTFEVRQRDTDATCGKILPLTSPVHGKLQ